jgi:hypothetical protein
MPCTHASRSLFLQQVVGVDIVCSLVDCFAPGSIDIRKLLPHVSVNAKIQSRLGDHSISLPIFTGRLREPWQAVNASFVGDKLQAASLWSLERLWHDVLSTPDRPRRTTIVKYIGSHVPRMEGGILDIHADAPHMSSLDLWLTREGVYSSEDGD